MLLLQCLESVLDYVKRMVAFTCSGSQVSKNKKQTIEFHYIMMLFFNLLI